MAYPNPVESLAREFFTFRPGAATMSGGAVFSGTRSGSPTVSGIAVNTIVWGADINYKPYRSGKIDGVATNGVIYGQLAVGVSTNSNNTLGKIAVRIRNIGVTAYTNIVAQTAAITLTTAENIQPYDIPYLFTDSNFNSVPSAIAVGGISNSTNFANARIMESSWIAGEFEPGV